MCCNNLLPVENIEPNGEKKRARSKRGKWATFVQWVEV